MTILYPGTFYKNKQNPEFIFQAINELRNEKKIPKDGIIIDFYGTEKDLLQPIINEYNVSDIVKIYDRIPKNKIIELEYDADVLLVMDWNDPEHDAGGGNTKLFEFLPLYSPILVIGYPNKNCIKNIIEETHRGVYCISIDDIKKHLGFWWMEKYGYEYECKKY